MHENPSPSRSTLRLAIPNGGSTVNISESFPSIVNEPPNSYEDADSQAIVAEQLERGRNIGTLVTSRAAERDGAAIQWHGGYTAIAEKDDRRILIRGHMCTDTVTSGQIVKDKYLTKQMLEGADVATPRGGLAMTPEEAEEIQTQLNTPVVVKPRFGAQGKQVTVNITSASEVRDAFLSIGDRKLGVIVEEYIDGVEFRLLATPEECFGAVRRLLPNVEGDGRSSILELINRKNELRRRNPNNCALMIPIDQTTDRHLARQGLDTRSILPAGERIIVRDVGGISSGGEASECLELLGSDVKRMASDAVSAIPTMDWGGVDILLSKETGLPYILEMNTNAAISNSTFPVYGRPKDVGIAAWKRMFGRSTPELETPTVVEPLETPVSLLEGADLKEAPRSRASSDLRMQLERYLQGEGWDVERVSDRLLRAEFPGKPDKWFRGLMDERFPASVSSLLRRHHTVRSILRQAGVSVPRATFVQGAEEIEAYRERAQTDLVIIPRNLGWVARTLYQPGLNPRRSDPTTRSLAQRVMGGNRLRVFSSRDRCLAFLSQNEEFVLTSSQAAEVGELAIQAVRAIPGLPWAQVDVVVRHPGSGRTLVEGMSTQRSLEDFGYLYGGSLDLVLEEIVGP